MREIYPVNNQFELMQLPYDPATLGVISSNTFGFHQGKHLKAYVDNLNRLLPGSGLEGLPITQVVKKADGGLFNNAGQVLNHVMYFEQFGPDNHEPSGRILQLIHQDFDSFEAFKKEFEQKGASLFGSGWVWLSLDADCHLVITQEPNAGNPVRSGLIPLLTFDVWEHAYYLDYQNRRPDYLNALWQIVDWQVIESRL
ncbi:MAG: superoxide dismutase [Bacteroidales bacterium]|nr:superoxide dismutase [Bacteroidales bacterium]